MPRSAGTSKPKTAAGKGNVKGPFLPFLTAPPQELKKLSDDLHLGFSIEEIRVIRDHFAKEGRNPTRVEIAGLAQSWSEHCSYKSSKIFLKKYFKDLPPNKRALAMGDAGVMPLDDEYAYALRIESHNHPSAIEPYGGAATGIGGILRDVLAMGAKPVALADPLFFGPLDYPPEELPVGIKHPRYLYRYVIAGIADYGNRVGVPTVSGSIMFDKAYLVNPLVNVGCVGLIRRKNLVPNHANHVGEKLVLTGGLTGRDGIGGVSFASKEITKKSETESRPAVQLGNPIMKEPLIHACLEAVEKGLISGIKDFGGGGLASCSGELAHAGGFGSEIHLDRVPLRETGLEPWEVWISESQERMLLCVAEKNISEVERIFKMHDVPMVVIGDITESDRERLYWKNDLVADLELNFRIEPPLPARSTRPRVRQAGEFAKPPSTPTEELLTEMLLSPHGASREPVLRLYDHEVQARTVGKPLVGDPRTPTHGDASVIRATPDGYLGLAIAVGSAPFVSRIDAERGGELAVEEAARNIYAVGGKPDSLTDCLNFGNPENPNVLSDFDSTVKGMAIACRDLDMAVPSGNVSFYNLGMGEEVPPTPVVLAVGIHPDVRRMVTTDLKNRGNGLYLLGDTLPSLGGSLYSRIWGGNESKVPPYEGTALRDMGRTLLALGEKGLIESCHDISEGGMGIALIEMAFGGACGFDVEIPWMKGVDHWRPLVSEGGTRWIIEVKSENRDKVEDALDRHLWSALGTVTENRGILRSGGAVVADMDLAHLYGHWRGHLAGED
jgi:phosphoribosylformylglycinamidine synthase